MPDGPNDHDMLHRIHTEMVGIDGQSGMVKEHHEIKVKVDTIEKNMMTKGECEVLRKGNKKEIDIKEEKKTKHWQTFINVLLTVMVVMTFLFGTGILKIR